LCARAASLQADWGLFGDNPEKLHRQIQTQRASRDREEADKLTAEARQLFNRGDLAEAKNKAFKAKQMHGPYGLIYFGDRADRLLSEIEVAEANQRKQGGPLVKDRVTPSTGDPAGQPSRLAVQARNTARELLIEARTLERKGQLAEAGQ